MYNGEIVIMPISDQGDYPEGHFDKIYNQIFKPAIEEAGYEAYRVDENKICDSIMKKIFDALYRCPMAVCDLSNRNPNVLYELGISKEAVGETERLFEEVPVLEETFASPVVPMREKLSSIDKIFPEEIKNFLKVVCRNQRMSEISQILFAYDRYCKMQEGIQMATLTCVEAPDEKRLEKIREFLCEKYHKTDVKIEIVKDPALLGGFILKTGDDEYDWSLKGRLSRLEQKLTWR